MFVKAGAPIYRREVFAQLFDCERQIDRVKKSGCGRAVLDILPLSESALRRSARCPASLLSRNELGNTNRQA